MYTNWSKVTVVPLRMSTEPVGMIAYDRWQDREGLQDASDECRAAWGAFQSKWRTQRYHDLRGNRCAVSAWIEGVEVDDVRGISRVLQVIDQGQNVSPEARNRFNRWRTTVDKYDLGAAKRFVLVARGKVWVDTAAEKWGMTEAALVAEMAALGRLARRLGV